MSDSDTFAPGSLSTSLAVRLDRQPRIEDGLSDMPEPGRPLLVKQLLKLELTHQARQGEGPTPDDSRTRFPASADLIEAAFGNLAAPLPSEMRVHAQAVLDRRRGREAMAQ
jgi:hypothetical protein